MAVTQDGFPVRSWVLPGNTVDVSTIAQVKRDRGLIERAWRTLKATFELMPVRHYAPRRIRAHVHLAQLALTLTRLVEVRSGLTWPEAQMVLDRVGAARLDLDLLGITRIPATTRQLLEKLQVPPMPRLMPFSGVRKVEREPKS